MTKAHPSISTSKSKQAGTSVLSEEPFPIPFAFTHWELAFLHREEALSATEFKRAEKHHLPSQLDSRLQYLQGISPAE